MANNLPAKEFDPVATKNERIVCLIFVQINLHRLSIDGDGIQKVTCLHFDLVNGISGL